MKEKDNISEINKELQGFSKLKSLKGKQSFQVPDSYFDNLEDDIMSKIATDNTAATRKFYMTTRQVLYYVAAASIVAIFIFIALRSGNQNANQPQIANQPNNTIIKQKNPTANRGNETIEKQDTQRNDESLEKVKSIDESAIALEEKNKPINKVSTKPNNTSLRKEQEQMPSEENPSSNYELANNEVDNSLNESLINQGGQSIVRGSGINQNTDYSPSVARKAVEKDLYLGEDQCSNKEIHLDASISSLDNLIYLWSTKDTSSSITVRKTGNYWVKIYDLKNNLLGSDTVNVRILETPKPNLGEDQSICNYESVLISSSCKNEEYTYKWSISNATTPEIYLSDLSPGIYDIELSVTTCADTVSSSFVLTVKDCNLKIPNVITPNGDGKNDRFIIVGLEYYPGSQLYIYDRSGKSIYETLDYKNNWSADNIPAGTYFYRLLLNDPNKTEKNGVLTIVR